MQTSYKDGLQWAWDATSLTAAHKCPRYYQYRIIEGWEPQGLSVHLLFGQLYASALEQFYKLRFAGASIDDALRDVVRTALIQSWDYENNCPVIFDSSSKSRINLIRTIVWYIEKYGNETGQNLKTLRLQNGKPAVELSFSFEVSDDIIFCGHLDRVVQMGNEPYIMDQKTTGSSLTNYYWRQFKPDVQMSMYSFAGQAILNSPIAGVIIDAAQITVGASIFARDVTQRSEIELEEWFADTMLLIEQTRGYGEKGHYPMRPTACSMYGGCPFHSVCKTQPMLRQTELETNFNKNQWDPIKRR